MYAVIDLNGTQVKVAKGDKVRVNRINGEDRSIKVDKVLFGEKDSKYFIGTPYVKGAYVECAILGHPRGEKVIAFKFRPRKNSQRVRGHRQDLTEVQIKDIHLA
jgi:large subunit ribosomal protein L21